MEENKGIKSSLFLKSAMYCSSTERCKSEVIERLKKETNSQDEIEEIVTILEQEGYINELRYATCYVRDKFKFNKWGKIKISYMLQCKKIPKDLIQIALKEIDESAYTQTLSTIINSKRKTIKSDNKKEVETKLYRFALSRGFEPSIIKKIIK